MNSLLAPHRLTILLLFSLLLTGCADKVSKPAGRYAQQHDSGPQGSVDIHSIPDAVPRYEPLRKAGNPDSYIVFGKRYRVMKSRQGFRQTGLASWYGNKFHGHKTSNGEVYDMYAMTAAHKTLPIPSYLRVTNLANRRSVIVRVNDRGPFHAGRIIDLSYVAAAKLGIHKTGTGRVSIETITPSAKQSVSAPGSRMARLKRDSAPSTRHRPRSNRIYLQVGAFSERKNAERMSHRLRHPRLPPTRILHTPGSALYRVQVGPLASSSDINQITDQLEQFGIRNTRLISH